MAKKKGSLKSTIKDSCLQQLLEDVELANQIIAYGKRRNMPEAIELAARILQDSISELLGKTDTVPKASARLEKEAAASPEEARFEAASSAGLVARGAGTAQQVGSNEWVAEINSGKTFTLEPHPLFAKKTQARVSATSKSNAKLFVYWRRVDLVSDPNDFAVGQGSATAKWSTGTSKARWEVQIENRNGPDNLQVNIKTNSIG